MTSATTSGPYELVDNGSLGSHRDALEYISAYFAGPLQVATALHQPGGTGHVGGSIHRS